MQKHFLFLLLVTGSLFTLKAQNVVGTHELIPGDAPGSYTIKTKVTGLQGVDIARITYLIDDSHTYVASANNAFFSDRNAAHVKFYIMSVPSTGILNVELGVKLSGEGEFVFPVSFQYSKDEQKKSINLPQLNIVNQPVIAAVTPVESETEPGSTKPAETGLEEKIRVEEEAAKKAAQEEAARKAAEEKAAQEEAAKKAAEEKAAQEEAAKKAAEEKAAQEEAAKKAAEEKAAQEEAARKAAEEKTAQEEAARKAAEEKVAQEEAAKQAAEEKAAQEEAAKQAAEEKAAQEEAARKAAEEKAAQETAAKKAAEEETARKAAEEKAAQEEAAKKAAEEEAAKKAAEEEAARKAAEEKPVVTSSAKYTVQILSLSEFSSSRLAQYCREHGLSVSDVVKRKVGQWTKISIGEVSSKNEALQIQERLRNQNNIAESFIVKLP